jgi:hypothetical protein
MVTGVSDYHNADEQLMIQGALSEAEVELACNAFHAEVIELEPSQIL